MELPSVTYLTLEGWSWAAQVLQISVTGRCGYSDDGYCRFRIMIGSCCHTCPPQIADSDISSVAIPSIASVAILSLYRCLMITQTDSLNFSLITLTHAATAITYHVPSLNLVLYPQSSDSTLRGFGHKDLHRATHSQIVDSKGSCQNAPSSTEPCGYSFYWFHAHTKSFQWVIPVFKAYDLLYQTETLARISHISAMW